MTMVDASRMFQNPPSLEDQLPHPDQVLGDLGEALLTLVSQEPRPVDQVLVDLLQSFLIVLTELHLQRSTGESGSGSGSGSGNW